MQPILKVSAPCLAVLLVTALHVRAGVVISEIMYHPVEKAAFDAGGDPLFDLSDDIHEFVEIHNPDGSPVALSGWKMSGGISYTFPETVVLEPGQFRVIAKNPARIAAVYGLAAAEVLGPWTGGLGNAGDTVRLENGAGTVVDGVSYSAASPWPVSADALGADDEWTGLTAATYQYRGRSLQRVSIGASGNDPANWVASPLPAGPTPGGPNPLALPVPRPVVLAQAAIQSSTLSSIIRANQPVRIQAAFSAAGAGVSEVTVEYFKDAINLAGEATTSVAMAPGPSGAFVAELPGQADRSVMRYRIKANRGAGVETVSPRADDPFAWHGYFVMPVRTSANPMYDVFISTTSLSRLNTNISQSPRRVTSPDPPGLPRASWNATEPAVFIGPDGVVRDIRLRYHGSRYRRSADRKSYKYQFPRYARFEGHESYFQTDKGDEHRIGGQLYEAAGLPVWRGRYIDLFQNSEARLRRLQQEEMDDVLYDRWATERATRFPGTPVEKVGEFYKATGVVPSEGGEGPYGVGTCQKIEPKLPAWTSRQRYEWTFGPQMHSWIGGRDFEAMINGLWDARGDTHLSPRPDLPRLRSWLAANFDVDATLTYIALRNWSSPIDNATHNYFLWRRPDGRWGMLPWDLDGEFGDAGKSIYWDESASPQPDTLRGPQWIKDSFLKAYREEYKQRLWILNNTVLLPSTFAGRGWSALQGYATSRHPNVNSQLGLGTFYRPATPAAVAPAEGASVLAGAELRSSVYAHGAPANSPAHAATTWLIRASGGTYAAPVLNLTTATDLTSLPIPFEALVFGQSYYWKCLYTDATGHPSFESAERRFSFGVANPTPAGAVRLSEILAHRLEGTDFIEVENTSAAAVELSAMGLTDDPATGAKYTFPAGTTLAAGGFHLVSLGTAAAFHLDRNGQTVLLLMPDGALADAVTFGPQARGLSLGRGAGNGWEIQAPTPSAANVGVATGEPASLRLNEWMASSSNGPDWIEIYNPGSLPVALAGLKLGDGTARTVVPPLSFVAGHGFQRFIADADLTAGPTHLAFKLSAGGDAVTLSDGADAVIDTVTFGPQITDVSEGRLPDGGPAWAPFPGSATPDEPNAQTIAEIVINALGPEVRLLNLADHPVAIAGWWLSDSLDELRKYQLPIGLDPVPAGAEHIIAGADLPFALDPVHGGTVYLSHGDTHRISQDFGAFDGSPYGRFETSTGIDFVRLTGTAMPHQPVVGPVVVSEINYHPPDLPGDDDDYEFVELLNVTGSPVDLSGWKLSGAIDYAFPPGTALAASGRLTVAGIAPAPFVALYDSPADSIVLGPWTGRLGNGGGSLRLIQPLPPVTTPGPDFGFVPEVTVERLSFSDVAPWPDAPDGTGPALGRIVPAAYGNEPLNWTGSPPSPGAPPSDNIPPSVTITRPADLEQIPVGAEIDLVASAADGDGTVKAVAFFVDGQEIGTFTSPPFSIRWRAMPPGSHVVSARAVDGRLAWTDSVPISIGVVNQPPTVTLTSPATGTAYSHPALIDLTAAAADPDGTVMRVEFWANGVKIGDDADGAPWTMAWTGASRGPYALTARAIDAYGAVAVSAPVSVSVARTSILAYEVPAGNVGTQNFTGGLGMDFDVFQPVVVTRLGVFDSGGNGLSSTLTVQLFRRTPTPAVLAAVSFSAAVPGPLEAGTSSRIKPLAAPLTLAPGSYSIVSYGHNGTDLNDNFGTRGSKPWTTDDGNGLLAFVGGGRYGGSPGQFPPSVDGGPADRYAAGTFEYTTPDADGDGLPYDWEVTHGLNPDDAGDAALDPDGDGESNLDEFFAGSNPADPSSRLTVALLAGAPHTVVARFPVFPHRTATLEWSADLAVWTTLQTIPPAANFRSIDITDPAPDTALRFYRITARP